MNEGYINWHPQQFLGLLDRHLNRNLDAAAIHMQRAITSKIGIGNIDGDQPSQPWTPPRRVTGDLLRSIGWMKLPFMRRRIGSGIGSGKTKVGYAIYLEFGTRNMLPRPYLRPALYSERSALSKILRTPMRVGG